MPAECHASRTNVPHREVPSLRFSASESIKSANELRRAFSLNVAAGSQRAGEEKEVEVEAAAAAAAAEAIIVGRYKRVSLC